MNNFQMNGNINFGANYKQFTKLIKKEGCNFYAAGKGSHMKWRGPSGDIVPIPNHGHKDLGKGLVDAICKQLQVLNPFKPAFKHIPLNQLV